MFLIDCQARVSFASSEVKSERLQHFRGFLVIRAVPLCFCLLHSSKHWMCQLYMSEDFNSVMKIVETSQANQQFNLLSANSVTILVHLVSHPVNKLKRTSLWKITHITLTVQYIDCFVQSISMEVGFIPNLAASHTLYRRFVIINLHVSVVYKAWHPTAIWFGRRTEALPGSRENLPIILS